MHVVAFGINVVTVFNGVIYLQHKKIWEVEETYAKKLSESFLEEARIK